MTEPTHTRHVVAGGAPLALFTVAGPFVAGGLGYSPSIGFLAGLGLGIAIALLIWLLNSR